MKDQSANHKSKNSLFAEAALDTCVSILHSNVLTNQSTPSWFQDAAFTCLMINLNDALQIFSSAGKRIAFKDDIPAIKNVSDITDLVANLRNVVCHPKSPKHIISNSFYRLNTFIGYCPSAMVVDKRSFGCEYDNDAKFMFGEYDIYLNRNIGRALKEALSRLQEI